jgi:hypothetical protein
MLDNAISMVSADLEEHRSDAVTRSSALSLMKQALTISNTDCCLAPALAARWSLELDDDEVYRQAIRRGIASPGARFGLFETISRHVETNFRKDGGGIDWEKR